MTFDIRHETLDDNDAIEQIVNTVFGPGRFAKTAYRLREAKDYTHLFGFVTENNLGNIVATVRIARLKGYKNTVILGPIAVDLQLRNIGLGMALMQKSQAECYHYPDINRIILVGDPAYYSKFGFAVDNATDIIFPGPVNKNRVLGKYLTRT
jgi:predicted N-acetyltransferase YhbS